MRLKFFFSFLAVIMLLNSSCKKDVKPAPWASLAFAGKFAGTQNCSATGSQANSITITATTATQINILNLYGTGQAFTGAINNDTCIITPHVYPTGSGNALLQGSMLLSNDSLTLSLIISQFSREETCQAVLVKQ